jgi:hypothetical protein
MRKTHVRKDVLREVMAHLGWLRAKKLSPDVRAKIASVGGKAAWAGMTAEERSAEMRKRAKKRRVTKRKPRQDQASPEG